MYLHYLVSTLIWDYRAGNCHFCHDQLFADNGYVVYAAVDVRPWLCLEEIVVTINLFDFWIWHQRDRCHQYT
jgi:hypothetical protein